MVKTQTDAIALQKMGEPSFLAIRRQGEDVNRKMIATIRLNLLALDRFLHLKNPLGEDEIDFIAEQIVDEFGGALTFADLHLVLKNVKSGKYGNLFERLSAPTIIGWFREYYDKRLDAAYQFNLNKDKEKYNQKLSDEILRQMYSLDNIIQKDKERKEKHEQELARQQAQIDKDNDYMKWRQEYEKNGTL